MRFICIALMHITRIAAHSHWTARIERSTAAITLCMLSQLRPVADCARRGPVLPHAGRGLEALTALRLLGVEEASPGGWRPAAGPEPGFAPRAPSEQDPGLPLAGRLCGLTALRELALGASDLIGL